MYEILNQVLEKLSILAVGIIFLGIGVVLGTGVSPGQGVEILVGCIGISVFLFLLSVAPILANNTKKGKTP